MPKVETLRPDMNTPPPQAAPALSAFAPEGPGRLAGLLAFALAVEAGAPATPEEIARLRARAAAELDAHAVTTMHNRIQEIRQEAVVEHLAHLPRPLGFFGAFCASLLALLLGAAAAAWLSGHGEMLHRLLAVFGG